MSWGRTKHALVITALIVGVGLGGLIDLTQLKGGRLLSVQTGSMVPVLERGDLVSVKTVPDNTLKVGDVITYIKSENSKVTVTHRIQQLPNESNNHKFIVKGDANRVTDPPVAPSKVLGKVTHDLPYAGYAVDFLRKPLGLLLIIWIPALLIIIEEMQKLTKHYAQANPYFSQSIRARRKQNERGFSKKLALAAKTMTLLVFLSLFVALPVQAALISHTTLTDTTITLRKTPPPPNQCSTNSTNVNVNGSGGSNNNSVVIINNSNSQTANSGNATSNGGSASSGNASNSNCTNININVNQH
jgi:signal peptidase